jgi:uncharacterized protein (AIM24 family)
MELEIHGELAQTARLTFQQGETCWCSNGSMMTLSPDLPWALKIPGGAGGAVNRALSGEGVSLTYIEANREGQHAHLNSNQPGKLVTWDLKENGPVVATSGSFTAAYGAQVDIAVTVAKRAGAAFFGGAGLFLQRVSGDGTALIHGAGDFIDMNLAEGESILVSTGNLAAFAGSVDYSIQSVSGCRRILFSGEGLFMTKLTGPGRVLLQSLKRMPVQAARAGGA